MICSGYLRSITISIRKDYLDQVSAICNMIISYYVSVIVIDESRAYLWLTVWIATGLHLNNRVFSIFTYVSPVIIVSGKARISPDRVYNTAIWTGSDSILLLKLSHMGHFPVNS